MESQNKEFVEADKKFNEIEKKKGEKVVKSNIELRKKIFMKISDVDCEDAIWLKGFADRHTAGKQFLAIKVLRAMAEKEHLYKMYLDHESRIQLLENPPALQDEKVVIPRTQGGRRK